MIGAYKTYDQSLSNKYDTPGRKVVKQFLSKQWNLVAEDYETYKVDLICKRDGVPKIFVEVEARTPFAEEFPFETVHVPSRKTKLFGNDLPTIYFVVNKFFTKALWVNTNKITQYPLIEQPNRLVLKGEMFYDVPKNEFKKVYVGN